MSDYQIPLNRVGVIHASMIDLAGAETPVQLDYINWSVTGGGSSYFSLVVAADGKSAEIHPIAEGSGSVRIDASSVGESNVIQTRTVEIVANASDPGEGGEYPRFIGTQLSIVHPVGALV